MRRRFARLSATLAVLANFAAPAAAAAAAAQAQAQAPAAPAWSSFRFEDGRFSVLFPTAPTRDDKPIAEGPGAPGSLSIFSARDAGGLWMAAFADYAPGFDFGVQAELEANRDNFVKGVGGTLLTSAPARLGAAPGLEFTAEKAGQWFVRGRIFIVGRRPYQILAMVAPARKDTPEIARFLASLQVDGAR